MKCTTDAPELTFGPKILQSELCLIKAKIHEAAHSWIDSISKFTNSKSLTYL